MAETRISPSEAAKLLGKSRNSVMKLIAARELPATDERLPGSPRPLYRIDRAELDRWRERRAVVGKFIEPKTPRTLPAALGTVDRLLAKQRQKVSA